MKLSERLKELGRSSFGDNLTQESLIVEIKALEEKADNWDLLEQLPEDAKIGFFRDRVVIHIEGFGKLKVYKKLKNEPTSLPKEGEL